MPLIADDIGINPYTYDNFLLGLQTDVDVISYQIANQSDISVLYKNLYEVLDKDQNSYLYKNILNINNNEYLGVDRKCDILKLNYIKNVIDYFLLYTSEILDTRNSVLSKPNKIKKIKQINSKYMFKCIEEYIRCKYGMELLNLFYKLIQEIKNYVNPLFLTYGDLTEILFGNDKNVNAI